MGARGFKIVQMKSPVSKKGVVLARLVWYNIRINIKNISNITSNETVKTSLGQENSNLYKWNP